MFLGDSLTEGYGVNKKDAYPAIVEKELKKIHKNVVVFNGGISGSTSASLKSRLRWFLKKNLDIVFIAIGANDGLRGQKIEQMEQNIEAFIKLCQEKKIKVILAQMMIPMNYGKEYREKFQKVYPKLAKKYAITYIPYLLEGVGGVKEMNIEDGIHPNEKGHKKMAQKVIKNLKGLL